MPPAPTRVLPRIHRLAETADDARELRLKVVDQLREAVGFDAYAWPLTDPVTAVGTAPVADVPWLAELPRQIRLKYLTSANRWTTLADPPVALLGPHGLERSRVWREMLRDCGVVDAASAVFRDRFGCWAFLELWRVRGEPFSAGHAAFIGDVVAVLTPALRRLQAATFQEVPAAELSQAGPVVLLLSAELVVRSQTPETQKRLRLLVPPAPGQAPVPAGAYNVAAQLLAVEAGVDDSPPWARVHLGGGAWMTLRAARLGEDDIAVTIDRSSPQERADLFGRAHGLSPREQELLVCLVAGSDTRETARRMLVTEHTVQDHLKSIFAKTGVRSRRSLLARTLGT